MDTFGFTRRKLLALAPENRHGHIIAWLTRFYRRLCANRTSPAGRKQFSSQYRTVLQWMEMAPWQPPGAPAAGREWIEAVSDRIQVHRLALGRPVQSTDLVEQCTKPDQVDRIRQPRLDCHLALDGIRSLFNAGSIIRTCEAAGFSSVILDCLPPGGDGPLKKTAMDADQWIRMEQTPDLGETLLKKKDQGYTLVGVETVQGSLSYDRRPWQDRTVLVLGNEEYGIGSHIMGICHEFVTIPMRGVKNSINVANAASVVCFHVANALFRARKQGNGQESDSDSTSRMSRT